MKKAWVAFQRLVICPWPKKNLFLIIRNNIVYYTFLFTANSFDIQQHWNLVKCCGVLWRIRISWNNPTINIIEHNWLNDHQRNAYMWLDWLRRCHLIIKRWHLELVNVLRWFNFDLSEFSAMKILFFFVWACLLISNCKLYYWLRMTFNLVMKLSWMVVLMIFSPV